MDPIIQHPALSELCTKLRPRSRLKEHHKHLFDGNNSGTNNSTSLLFDELALVACSTGVVCRKELLETYAAATFIHAKFPHMKRMADLAAGHGLLSWFLLALDHYETNDDDDNNNSGSKPRTIVCVDRRMPPSADAIATAMIDRFPALEQRWSYVQSDLSAIVPHPSCVLTSVHACGTLSDYLLDMAIRARAPLAIVPCCHTVKKQMGYQPHVLSGMDAEGVAVLVEERKRKQENAKHEAVADVVDEVRCRTLRNAGYDVEEVMLPVEFTGRNRVLLGEPTCAADEIAGVKIQQPFQKQGKVATMPSLIRIPLADDHESIAHCHAISGRVRAATKPLLEQIPKDFSLHMSIWLTGKEGSSEDSVIMVEALQILANHCCGENEREDIQCTVEIFGEVNVQSTTGWRSQLYRFKYSKPEGANRSGAGVWRIAAKKIHSTLRESILDNFGDVLR